MLIERVVCKRIQFAPKDAIAPRSRRNTNARDFDCQIAFHEMLVCIGGSSRDVEGWDVNCWQATEPFVENTAEGVRGLTVQGGSRRQHSL